MHSPFLEFILEPHSLILDFFTLIELAEMAKLAVFGGLEKNVFTLFCFEVRKAQKSHCAVQTSQITLCTVSTNYCIWLRLVEVKSKPIYWFGKQA